MLLFGSLFLHSVGLLKAFLFPQTRNRDSVLKALNGHSDHRQIEMKKILPKSPSDFLCKCVQSCFFYHNNTVSVFHIRRYGATDENLLRNIHYSALKQTQIDVQTLEGQMEREVLLAGIIDGSFRSGLKAEIGILFPMLILRVLENVLQPSFLQKMTILNLLDKIGGDSQIIIGILVNYDCDVDSPNIFERVVNCLLKTSLGPPSGSTTTLSAVQDILLRHESVQCLVSTIKSMGAWMGQQLKIGDSDLPRSFESDTSSERHSTSIVEDGVVPDCELHPEMNFELLDTTTLEQRQA